MGQEYYHAHRALRTLAEELASLGRPALRFDYFGTGDSGGDPRDADLDGWKRDVRTAAEEVRAAAAVGSVALVGLGLGGVLAARAADAALTRALVLWDPVVDGPRYLEGLKDSQERFLREYPGPSPQRPPRGYEMESRGFPLTTRLLRDLEEIRMLGEEPPQVEAVLWVEGASDDRSLPDGAWFQPTVPRDAGTERRPGASPRPTTATPRVERLSLPEERGWREPGGHDTGLVPHRTVEAVARWLATGPETSEAP